MKKILFSYLILVICVHEISQSADYYRGKMSREIFQFLHDLHDSKFPLFFITKFRNFSLRLYQRIGNTYLKKRFFYFLSISL